MFHHDAIIERPPLFWISGPPAAGKSTLCRALIAKYELGVIIPVDDIREFVVSGYAGPSPWTDETERQYRLGEEAACEVARLYLEAGFVVVIDACRNPQRIDEVLSARLSDTNATKVLLRPELEENYRRSHTRTNKSFDPHFLDEIIKFTHSRYLEDADEGWLILDTTYLTVAETVQAILD